MPLAIDPQTALDAYATGDITGVQTIARRFTVLPKPAPLPRLVSHPLAGVLPSVRLMVLAVNEAGVTAQFDVLVPLAYSYDPCRGAQSVLNRYLERGWTVIAADNTGDCF